MLGARTQLYGRASFKTPERIVQPACNGRCSILNTASNKSLRSQLNSMASVLDQEQKLTDPSSSSSVLQW